MTITEAAAGVVLAVAGVTALGVIIRWMRGGFRVADDAERLLKNTDAILSLVKRELEHNHGGSLKDDVHGIAVSVHRAHNRIDVLEDTLSTLAEANSLVLPIIQDAINATPPEERA